MDVWIEHPLKMLTTIKSLRKVCQQGSVDSSAPTILPPRVRVPSTPSMLLSIYIDLCHVEKTKINKKEARIGPFLKRNIMFLGKVFQC